MIIKFRSCIAVLEFYWMIVHERERKWDLLEGPKGRYGWGHHPYTLLTAIFYVIKTQVEWILFHIQKDNLTWGIMASFWRRHIFPSFVRHLKNRYWERLFFFFSSVICLLLIFKNNRKSLVVSFSPKNQSRLRAKSSDWQSTIGPC